MIKPNWNNFLAKFNENPQINFEWFCYLMFCQEFKNPAGIFRYKNQSGIETNPIIKGDEVIGWQSKFYGTKLSENKSDLLGMIAKCKKNYSNLTKIIFYTNQEWGQGENGNPSEIKKEVDQFANNFGIEIDWRTASFFESPLVAIENEKIAKHFFFPEKSIFDLLEEKQKHSDNILYEIQTVIDFKDKKIEIDRCELVNSLRESLDQKRILIVSGAGGVGKTAVIKKLYQKEKDTIPFYVFKASEFNKDSINDLFRGYSLEDFVSSHREEIQKVIVVDSAEKLLELANTDPFKEFLTVLIKDKWQVIFTTRNNYLTDLNYDFIDIYKIRPGIFGISNIIDEELKTIAFSNGFNLPADTKLLDLISNPFYLSEYLRFYTDENIDYANFKEKLWGRVIVKNTPDREQCFLATAFQRANSGQFYVTPGCDAKVLDALVKDGILGYETAGYFITHDIYEEWALEKKIAVDYIRKSDNKDFFENIGESLPVRRSFRAWVSERLLLSDKSIKRFSAEIVQADDISKFWQDELWVAILLSEHAAIFIDFLKKDLLRQNHNLLKRLTFLLRLACKEVDYDILKQIGVNDSNLLSIKYVLTKPKGTGWQSSIRFIYDNLEVIGSENILFILPVIHEWNQKVKKGETTRLSSLIALKYYQWTIEKGVYLSREDGKQDLLHTITHGAAMIKFELEGIFNEVTRNKWNNPRDPYFDLMKVILTDVDAFPVWMSSPEYVLQVADQFWYRPPEKDGGSRRRMEIEDEFCLRRSHYNYFPESAYQTPIYWLLQSALKKTIDFVLDFTNKTTGCFANSHLAKDEIEEVDVFIEDGKFVRQYICDRLWCSYRGTKVSTHLLSSIHMALEKFFLERKEVDSKVLEDWLLYLLRNSKSVSISAVVTSIVLAFPEKTFNVAKVLFQTKDFFFFDAHRFVLDQSQKSSLISLRDGFGGPNNRTAHHEEDRIKACDDPHRKNCLEHLALSYQIFRTEGISEEDAEERQKAIWSIFDKYYSQFPDEIQETNADKTWRLFLARMDRRKMKIITEVKDHSVQISFNPEIDSKLMEYSEETLKKNSEHIRYLSLKLWASYKIYKDDRYKQYDKYENNPQVVLQDTREIINSLNADADYSFRLFNSAIPADACSILLTEYLDRLSEVEKKYCKDIILEYSKIPLMPHYRYQISDGTTSAISALPVVFRNYPDDREVVKINLLLTLFNDDPIGMSGGSYSAFPSMAIHKLWDDYFDDMQSLLFGYLIFKPRYEELRQKLREENYSKGSRDFEVQELNESFLREYEERLQEMVENAISINSVSLSTLELTDPYILNTAFQLIPLGTANVEHKLLASSIIGAFSSKILSRGHEDKIDYSIRHSFFEKLAYFALKASTQDISDYLKPFLDDFKGSESIADLFQQFISVEDRLHTHDKFWHVWNMFLEKLVFLCKDGGRFWYLDKIIKSYLFAHTPWKESTNGWHAFKESNSQFFAEVAKNMGHRPSVLYSLAKSLNNAASGYLHLGIQWLSGMLARNKELWGAELESNTIYYLESLVRRYIYGDRERIRRTKQFKEELLVILDFLVEKGSVVGYMSRENIL